MKKWLPMILLGGLAALVMAGGGRVQAPEPSPSPEIIAPGCDSPDCNVSKPMTIHFLKMDGTWIQEDRIQVPSILRKWMEPGSKRIG